MCYCIILLISSGEWSSPVTTGNTPLPRRSFSFLKVNGSVIMFGGFNKYEGYLGDIYTLNINKMVNKRELGNTQYFFLSC